MGQALLWRLQDPLNRRVAVVTSMSSLGKVNYADDKNYNLLDFMVFSWTLEEYLQAIECEELLRSVLFLYILDRTSQIRKWLKKNSSLQEDVLDTCLACLLLM